MRKIKVLYLEPDSDLRTALPGFLGDRHEVVSTGSISEALKLVRGEAFDVMMLEIIMPPPPEMSNMSFETGRETGVWVAQQVRSIKPALPMVAFTILTDPVIRQKVYGAGVSNIVQKPANRRDLLNALRPAS